MSNKLGLTSEIKFQLEALSRDLIVSKPLGDKEAYDLITDNGKSLKKVQIKSTSFHRKRWEKTNASAFEVKLTNNKGVKYSKKDVDIFAIFIEPLNIWYLIPHSIVKSLSSVTLYPSGRSKYNKYCNNWRAIL